jgi:hypothetical protein
VWPEMLREKTAKIFQNNPILGQICIKWPYLQANLVQCDQNCFGKTANVPKILGPI